MLDVLLHPFARAIVSRVQTELDQVPHPTDVPRYHAAGPDPDRVLVFGNGPANGFGVRTQELALPGQIGRRLAAATGRGADVDLVARRRTSVEVTPALVADLRPARYDGIVVVFGATDAVAFLSTGRWRTAMTALLAELLDRASPGSPIVTVGIDPLWRSSSTAGMLGDLVDQHARRLNAVTRELCDADPRLTYVERGATEGLAQRGVPAFQHLGALVAAALLPGLQAVARDRGAGSSREVRGLPDPEPDRQAAVEALGLLDTAPEERFDRLVRAVRSSLGVAVAAVSLIDGDRQWYKAIAVDREDREVPRQVDRHASLCDRAIRSDQPLVIVDLAADPAFARLVAAGYRFYAGVPIESPDGYRVGTLCVLDVRTRQLEDVDLTLLREFAVRVQRELWASGASADAGTPVRLLARSAWRPAAAEGMFSLRAR